MYKGVSRLVGMDVIEHTAQTPAEEFAVVKEYWDKYDFFFVHIKKTDSYGEDGNFDARKHVIESVDAALPNLLDLTPDVLVITRDHSNPPALNRHTWHRVPVRLPAETTRRDPAPDYG